MGPNWLYQPVKVLGHSPFQVLGMEPLLLVVLLQLLEGVVGQDFSGLLISNSSKARKIISLV
jgi:hypothetical protein